MQMTFAQAIEKRNCAEMQLLVNQTRLRDLRHQTKFHSTPAQRQVRRELEGTVKNLAREVESWDYTIAELQWYGEKGAV